MHRLFGEPQYRHDVCDKLIVFRRLAEVGVKYYHFDSLYESGSFGRIGHSAPKKSFVAVRFTLDLEFSDFTAPPRATPGGCGGQPPAKKENRF